MSAAASSLTASDSIFLHPGFYAAVLVLLAVFYVLKSIGLTVMARNRNMGGYWLGWVPVADFYIVGRLCGSFRFFGFPVFKASVLLPLGLILVILAGHVPVLGVVVGVVYFFFCCCALYSLFSLYSPENAIWFLLLSVLMLFPVIIYIIRNNYPHADYS